jgi:IS5 family transposase
MLRDQHEIDQFFMRIQSLASEMDAELVQIDTILDDEAIFQGIKADLSRRYPQTTRTGRPSTPVEVILRMLVIKRLYRWSYAETEHHVRDSLVLRRFCRIYFESVPDDTVLLRWAGLVAPHTLEALNTRVTAIAKQLRVTRGRKLRCDGTVVETNIHYPTDSSLLSDGVRVLSRLLKRAPGVLTNAAELGKEVLRDRTRSAKRIAQQIGRQAQRSHEVVQSTYRRLIHTAQASLRQAQTVAEALATQTEEAADILRQQLDTFIPRVAQVIAQTTRRVLQGQKVAAEEKLVSLFEPHSQIIKRGKPQRDVEFGHKIWLDEVDGGIISHFRILEGNAPDSQQWQASLDQHIQQFGHPPYLASADRGVYSEPNERYAQDLGVSRVILPKPGAKSPARRQHEHQPWFRRGRRWHAGIEGRISVVKRKHGLGRCLDHGEDGFGRWIGWGVIAANVAVIGHTLVTRA